MPQDNEQIWRSIEEQSTWPAERELLSALAGALYVPGCEAALYYLARLYNRRIPVHEVCRVLLDFILVNQMPVGAPMLSRVISAGQAEALLVGHGGRDTVWRLLSSCVTEIARPVRGLSDDEDVQLWNRAQERANGEQALNPPRVLIEAGQDSAKGRALLESSHEALGTAGEERWF